MVDFGHKILRLILPGLAGIALLLAPMFGHLSAFGKDRTLGEVEAQVAAQFSGVDHLDPQDAYRSIGSQQDLVLIDVRESDEYAVSRIAGALRVDPGIWRSTFLARMAGKVTGKTVVFYCSVGVRSSQLAAEVQAGLKRNGARAVYNLRGGIFAWHNKKLPLVDGRGATKYVHPFNAHWGKLLTRAEFARMAPGSG